MTPSARLVMPGGAVNIRSRLDHPARPVPELGQRPIRAGTVSRATDGDAGVGAAAGDSRKRRVLRAVGMLSTLHDVPFHASARVESVLIPLTTWAYPPTARQLFASTQLIPYSPLLVACAGAAVSRADQAVPLCASASRDVFSLPLRRM